jgi:hypothetical protein
MGEIVFWTIIRIVILIPIIWAARGFMDYSVWWSASILAIYGVIIHPTIVHYQLFREKNKDIIEYTLCSSCKYFDETAVLCLKYDEHPTRDYLPCGGVDWEPKDKNDVKEDITD